MAMDVETKGILDSLLSGKKRASRAARFDPPRREAYSFTKAPPPASRWDDWTSKTAERIKPKVYCYNFNEDQVNLKEQSATLCVDTASASIILKAVMNTEVTERINSSIPTTQRDWDDKARVWRFSPAALPMLKPLLKELYKDIIMLGVPKALPATKFDQLMAKLDKDDRAAIYRILATKYHPDKGGSHDIMTLINIVFRGS